MKRLALLTLAMVGLAACASTSPTSRSSGTMRGPTAVTDPGPLHVPTMWTHNGQLVPTTVIVTFHANDYSHCAYGIDAVGFRWPLGSTVTDTGAEYRTYGRVTPGPPADQWWRLFGSLDLHASLPRDAKATGYRAGNIALYLAPSDEDTFIYLAAPGRTERWPLVQPRLWCE